MMMMQDPVVTTRTSRPRGRSVPTVIGGVVVATVAVVVL